MSATSSQPFWVTSVLVDKRLAWEIWKVRMGMLGRFWGLPHPSLHLIAGKWGEVFGATEHPRSWFAT